MTYESTRKTFTLFVSLSLSLCLSLSRSSHFFSNNQIHIFLQDIPKSKITLSSPFLLDKSENSFFVFPHRFITSAIKLIKKIQNKGIRVWSNNPEPEKKDLMRNFQQIWIKREQRKKCLCFLVLFVMWEQWSGEVGGINGYQWTIPLYIQY